MNVNEAKGIIEAVLFASGEPVDIVKLEQILEMPKSEIKEIVKILLSEYQDCGRGLNIIEIDDAYQMSSKADYHPYIKRMFGERKKQPLSNSSIEVLTVIAYKQPVTKAMVEHIRGVNSDYAVARLLEKGLIEERGRLDAPGKPFLYGTTDEFLRCFGLKNLSEA